MGCLKTYFYEGKDYTIDELSDKFGLCPKQIRLRLKEGIALDKKIGSGRKSKYPTFVWNGEEISMTEAMHRCGCGKSTLYKLLDEGKTLDEIKAIMDAKRLSADGESGGYETGWISVEQVAKKFNVNYEQLKWIIRSRGIERRNFTAMHGQRMAIKLVDIDKAVRLTLEMVESLKKKAGPEKSTSKAKTLEELKAEHPLVTDERCFEESWFPTLETFNIDEW